MDIGILTGNRKIGVDKWASKNRINPDFAKSLADSLMQPEEMTYLLEKMIEGFFKLGKASRKEVRNALLRVQIYCSINTNTDPIKVSKQHFIAQTLEKLLCGSNVLFMEEIEVDEKPARKATKKRKSGK
jgi:hypothetical protein